MMLQIFRFPFRSVRLSSSFFIWFFFVFVFFSFALSNTLSPALSFSHHRCISLPSSSCKCFAFYVLRQFIIIICTLCIVCTCFQLWLSIIHLFRREREKRTHTHTSNEQTIISHFWRQFKSHFIQISAKYEHFEDG